MDENKNNLEIDTFIKKSLKEIPQEETSMNFTASIMKSILEEESKKSVFETEVLISKKGWTLIFGMLVALLFIPFRKTETSFISIPKVNFSFLEKFQIPNIFESFSISSTTQYAIFFCGLMIIAQVIFLKEYFEKRLN